MPTYTHQSIINAPAQAVFQWHLNANAFQHLTPPWEPVSVVEQTGPISQLGSRTTIKMALLGLVPLYWVAEHTEFSDGPEQFYFTDVQRSGPFAYWKHTHRVTPITETQCQYTDSIDYRLPMGWLGQLVAGKIIKAKLQRLFNFRHQVVAQAFT